MDYLARNQVHCGDVRELAGRLEPQSVQTIVTSPPYFSLRSYLADDHPDKAKELGSEATPAEFVANLVAVFAALRPALKNDGVLWLNLGDSYAVNGGGRSYGTTDGAVGRAEAPGGQRKAPDGYPPKCLLGMPWRVAFALIDDGWILRSEIIWSKPAPMPESVSDRVTRSHEYLFMFVKNPRYFYDQDAIREPQSEGTFARFGNGGAPRKLHGPKHTPDGEANVRSSGSTGVLAGGRNKRSVWTIPSAQFPGSHFATFPPDLVRPCILSGTSAAGECSACGKAWARCVEKGAIEYGMGEADTSGHKAVAVNGNNKVRLRTPTGHTLSKTTATTTGWAAQCACGAPTRPQTVLDPFMGSGTVAQVAHELGRDWIGLDLDERAIGWTNARLAKMPVGTLKMGA